MVVATTIASGGIPNEGFEKDGVDNVELDGLKKSAIQDEIRNENQLNATNKNNIILRGDDEENIERCGLGCFSPEWMQKFATKRVFLIVFSILGVIQSMSWSYFSATLTTLEKRFRLSSQTAGVVMTGNEVSQIIFSIILAYYGTSGHRPRWIAIGVFLSAIACYLLAAPHIFYGSGSVALSYTTSAAVTNEKNSKSFLNNLISDNFSHVSTDSDQVSDAFKKGIKKYGQPCLSDSFSVKTQCNKSNDGTSDYSLLPLVLIFLSQFTSGIGVILFFTLGGPYLDDNTSKDRLPIVFGITSSFRLIGPTLGYILASGCLKLYVNPLLTPVIGNDDPRWIGAWWLGWIIVGSLMVVAAYFIALFPKELRSNKKSVQDPEKAQNKTLVDKSADELVKISELPKAIKVLLTNKINLFNTLAGIFYLFAAIGYWTYSPKYLETIFLQSASNASITSGLIGIGFQAAGLLGSGFIISKFKPSARLLAGWNVAIAFLHVGSMLIFTQVGCNPGQIEFGTSSSIDLENSNWNLTSTCNLGCGCQNNKILPVCYKGENKLYFSPCHAGCQKLMLNGTLSDCKCLDSPTATVELGTCSEGCFTTFFIFLASTAVIKFLDSTGRIGNTLVAYRCVDKKDRSLSIGIGLFLISIFALLPAPIVFGAIIDSVCLIWNKSDCQSGNGNCLFYDGQKLRYVFNVFASVFIFIGGVLDCFVWYYVKDLQLYSDPVEQTEDKPIPEKESEQSSNK